MSPSLGLRYSMALSTLHKFVRNLKERYSLLVEKVPMDADKSRDMQYRLNALRLADAALCKNQLLAEQPDAVKHIGILGPTQAGKSTLVNSIVSHNLAGVSALAGYTVHAQGFVIGAEQTSTDRLHAAVNTVFHDFERVPHETLNHEQFNQYTLTESKSTSRTDIAPVVLWDSPDFDSIESIGYRSAVLRVAAVADVVILMTSKDKYADKTVWDMLDLIIPLGKPLIVCINKLSPDDAKIVTHSFLQRLTENQPEYVSSLNEKGSRPDIISIPYIKELDDSASQISSTVQEQLLTAISSSLAAINRQAQCDNSFRLIKKHWNSWLEPVDAEINARTRWEEAVDDALDDALQTYRAGYLDHPQKYDTFNRALAELLNLLEIPGLANALGTTRRAVTWPVRKLFKLGQSVVDPRHRDNPSTVDLEKEVLEQVLNQIFSRLGTTALEQSEQAQEAELWWTILSQDLRKLRTQLDTSFQDAIVQYQKDFEPNIEQAAQQLYSNLKDQPALLNTLRAARVSTDAAAVVLAVKSGGLAATDLVLAPAMLSLTTMLTEGALGKYMDSVKADLMQQQFQLVKQLVADTIGNSLIGLTQGMQDERLLLVDAETVFDANTELDARLVDNK